MIATHVRSCPVSCQQPENLLSAALTLNEFIDENNIKLAPKLRRKLAQNVKEAEKEAEEEVRKSILATKKGVGY